MCQILSQPSPLPQTMEILPRGFLQEENFLYLLSSSPPTSPASVLPPALSSLVHGISSSSEWAQPSLPWTFIQPETPSKTQLSHLLLLLILHITLDATSSRKPSMTALLPGWVGSPPCSHSIQSVPEAIVPTPLVCLLLAPKGKE